MSDPLDSKAYGDAFESLQGKLSYAFEDPSLLCQALTHRSFSNESKEKHNERLEFLGDAVLDEHISMMLFRRYPDATEGTLTRYRASLVREPTLAAIAIEYELGPLLRLGRGELQTGGKEKPRLLASALEAVIGAIRLDGGIEASAQVVRRLFEDTMSEELEDANDSKSRLQERVQRLSMPPPTYRLLRTSGPEHNKRFVIEVVVASRVLAEGEGRSKSVASKRAAQRALALSDEELVTGGENKC